MLRDDLSSYRWIFSFPDRLPGNAARAIIYWSAAFGVPNRHMPDGPKHFKYDILQLVSKGLLVPHHFILPYTPWSTSVVERLGEELLGVFCDVSSELRLRPGEWPNLLPSVQSALNHAPSLQQAGVSPIKPFTEMDATSSIAPFHRTATCTRKTVFDIAHKRTLKVENLSQLVKDA